ncbi:MAG: hypothetical protein WCG76_11450 [Verrucomicrobiota bacterium]
MKTTLFLLAVLAATLTGHAAVKSTEEKSAAALPPVWAKAGPRERLKAVRAAELDGNRLLAERIYGIAVDGDTTVYDLALENDDVRGAVSACLLGVVTTGEPEFFEDGRVELVRAVRIQDVIERLNTVIKNTKLDSGRIKVESSSKRTVETKEKNIDVMGNAALPGSEGQQKVLAKRAAELDAYRRLAERVMGMKINGESTMRDFAIKNDRITAAVAAAVKGATPTAIKYKPDGTCEVTLELKIEDIIRTTKRHIHNGSEKIIISDSSKIRTFSETGTGTRRESENQSAESASPRAGDEPFFDTKIIVEQVVSSRPVVR